MTCGQAMRVVSLRIVPRMAQAIEIAGERACKADDRKSAGRAIGISPPAAQGRPGWRQGGGLDLGRQAGGYPRNRASCIQGRAPAHVSDAGAAGCTKTRKTTKPAAVGWGRGGVAAMTGSGSGDALTCGVRLLFSREVHPAASMLAEGGDVNGGNRMIFTRYSSMQNLDVSK